jgi:radical SAM protein with 4Fe4S-binding SPASM domain
MGTLIDLSKARRDNAGLVSTPVEQRPPGCKGHACPAFALCQGRCETRRVERRAPDYPGGTLSN